jgi:hypothetical protein
MAFGKRGEDPIDQARALRMTLAVLDNNTWEFHAVIEEMVQDPRTSSPVELIVALAEGLAREFSRDVGVEAARSAIAFQLIAFEEDGK